MLDKTFWDRLSDDDGGARMTHRQAARIIREQKVHCLLWQDGEEVVCTGGTREHPPAVYDLALRVHFGYEPALQQKSPAPRSRAKSVQRSHV